MAASWHLQMDGLIGGSVNGWLVQMILFLLGPKDLCSGAFFLLKVSRECTFFWFMAPHIDAKNQHPLRNRTTYLTELI